MSSERVPREVIDLWWDLCRDKLGAGKKKDICSFLVTRHRSNPELTSVLPGDIVRAVWDKNYSGNEGTQAFRTTKTQLREKLLDIYRMDDEGRIPVLDINAGNVFSFMVPRLVDRISRGVHAGERWGEEVQELWNDAAGRIRSLCQNPAYPGRADDQTIELLNRLSVNIGKRRHGAEINRDIAWLRDILSRGKAGPRRGAVPQAQKEAAGEPATSSAALRDGRVPAAETASITLTIGLSQERDREQFLGHLSGLDMQTQLTFLLHRNRKWSPAQVGALLGEPVAVVLRMMEEGERAMCEAILSAADDAEEQET
jgi:hypothetical protein